MQKLRNIIALFIILLAGCSMEGAGLDTDFTNQTEKAETQEEPVVENETSPADSKNAQETSTDKKLVNVQLVKPIDGDTIKVNIDGKEENVRFLLVDTPETNHPRLGEQPYGQEAKDFTSKMVESGQVQLEFDISHRDKYQRLLAYVYVDGVSVQEELLKNGLARVAYIYEPNTKYVDQYNEIQKEAQQQAIGIWSVENYATDRGFDASVINSPKEEKEPSSNSSSCDIKGNIAKDGEKIYHMPDQQFYEVTKPEEMFCTEQEAVDAGFRKSMR
ncbi:MULTISPECIES: thermonuclease family protein [Bacillaceae]|uniref:thermonuclease family protein n=1 Tax=Bacillaceae TaxID=186817 RepID=UPI001CDA82E5|nr:MULTISPECIES: thermonuclease family protein [Bacillaceae]MED4474454.1 thermonuclease family protein [Oceanobacillus caeni]